MTSRVSMFLGVLPPLDCAKASFMPAAPRRKENASKSSTTSSPQAETGGQPSPVWRRPLVVASAVLGLFLLGVGIETVRLLHDPHVYFLQPEGSAEWIRFDQKFELGTYPATPTGLMFEHAFHTSQPVSGARLTVRAFRRCLVVLLDQVRIDVGPEDLDSWQETRHVRFPEPLAPGDHLLQIAVLNSEAHPCLLAYCEQLGIRTNAEWFVTQPGGARSRAITATQRTEPDVAVTYPTVRERAARVAPWLLVIFAGAFAWTFWTGSSSAKTGRWHVRPWHVRWALLVAWIVLAVNNIAQVAPNLGYDLDAHLKYIQYIAERHALPLANEGWEMFQPPLFYLLEAPWYALLSPRFDPDVIVRVLRFVPLLCGLAQIEIVYRAARAVFPDKEDLQILATLVGGLLPVHIYIAQTIGNEPLAGALTALAVLMCLHLLVEPERARTNWYFAGLGAVWALAILSKATPLLLAPLIVATIAVGWRVGGVSFRRAAQRTGIVGGTCLIIAGWFFLRNMVRLGKPFVGNWDAIAARHWWQEPSYRTWSQLTSFGTALSRPIYGGIWSFWDGLYSSLWLDSFAGGNILTASNFPWNLDWSLAGAWLGLVPMALLLASPASCWRTDRSRSRRAVLFALAAIAVYLAALYDFYIRLPIYSTAHARFLVGLLPCSAILAAAGAAPLLRFRLLRAVLFAAISCWAIAAYLAYFDFAAIRHLLGSAP